MTRTILQADGPARLAPSCRRETALGEEMSDEAEQKAEQILLEFPDHYSPSNLQVVMAVAAAIREAWQAGHDAADGEPYTDYKSNTRSLQIPCMSDHEATAKRLLPCCNKSLGSCMFDNQHFPSCPAYYRPAVAAALAERDGLQEQFDAAYRDAVYFRKRCEELENPMECGHYAANLQPDDANADICVVCAEIAMVKAEATAKAGKP